MGGGREREREREKEQTHNCKEIDKDRRYNLILQINIRECTNYSLYRDQTSVQQDMK